MTAAEARAWVKRHGLEEAVAENLARAPGYHVDIRKLGPRQRAILAMLREHGPARTRDVAAAVFASPYGKYSAAHSSLRLLERRGFVTATPNTNPTFEITITGRVATLQLTGSPSDPPTVASTTVADP